MVISIGIDLGGTQVRAALVEDGRVIDRSSLLTDVQGGPEAVLNQFDALIASVGGLEKTTAVGICAPGPLDTKEGCVIHIPTLPGWNGFELRKVFAERSGRAVLVENDAIAATYGEWQFGAGRGLENLVYVTVSTGIGGGAVIDGRLLHGRRGMVAHVGHFQMIADGPRCSCGARGCFEALASGSALVRNANYGLSTHQESSLFTLEKSLDGRMIVEAARAGDTYALQLLEQEAKYLGYGFSGLIHLYSPDKIIMGGGVSNAFDLLIEGIRCAADQRLMEAYREIPIVAAELGGDAGLIGVATLAQKTEHAENNNVS